MRHINSHKIPKRALSILLSILVIAGSIYIPMSIIMADNEKSPVKVTAATQSTANLQIIHKWDAKVTPTPTINIRIYDADEKELTGSPITLSGPNYEAYVKIDTTGNYTVIPDLPAGFSDVESTSVKVYVHKDKTGNNTIGSVGVVPTWDALRGDMPYGSVSNNGIIVFGNATRTGGTWWHSEGGLWVKGNLTHEGMLELGNVPAGYPAGNQAQTLHPRLMVGGTIKSTDVAGRTGAIWLHNGTLLVTGVSKVTPGSGGIWYGETASRTYYITTPATAPGGQTTTTMPTATTTAVNAFFNTAYADLKSLNTFLLNGAGTSPDYIGNVLRMTVGASFEGNNLIVNPPDSVEGYDTVIFDITPPGGIIENVYINYPAGFTGKYVFNVLGSSTVTFKPVGVYEDKANVGPVSGPVTINGINSIDGSYSVLAREFSNRIVWNFPANIDITTEGIVKSGTSSHGYNLIGTILAPDSDFKPCQGSINGEVICKNLVISSLGESWEQHTTSSVGYGNVSRAVVTTHKKSDTDNNDLDIDFEFEKITENGTITDEIFTFIVEEIDENGDIIQGGFYEELETTLGLTAGSEKITVSIKNLTIGETYYYKITEKDDQNSGWTYSDEEYIVKVDIADSGSYTVTYNGDIDIYTNIPEFTNTRNLGSLEVSKKVEGDGADTEKDFTFIVYFVPDTATGTLEGELFSSGDSFTLKHGESKQILDIPYGTEYIVTEAEADQNGYSTGSVGAAGTIGETIAGTEGETEEESVPEFVSVSVSVAEFTNAKSILRGGLKVFKYTEGNDIDAGKKFEFIVTFSDGGTYNEIDSGGSFFLGNGDSKVFTGIPEGVTYEITETEANINGYETVAIGETGTIEADIQAESVFINTKWRIPTVNITVDKKWVGDNLVSKDARPESVTIILKQNGSVFATQEIKSPWSYTFEDLPEVPTATSTDLYVYTVEEADVPEDYESSVNGFTITNTYKEKKTTEATTTAPTTTTSTTEATTTTSTTSSTTTSTTTTAATTTAQETTTAVYTTAAYETTTSTTQATTVITTATTTTESTTQATTTAATVTEPMTEPFIEELTTEYRQVITSELITTTVEVTYNETDTPLISMTDNTTEEEEEEIEAPDNTIPWAQFTEPEEEEFESPENTVPFAPFVPEEETTMPTTIIEAETDTNTVTEEKANPKTGDNIIVIPALMGLMILGTVAGVTVLRRTKKSK